jgi:hypothetical protein
MKTDLSYLSEMSGGNKELIEEMIDIFIARLLNLLPTWSFIFKTGIMISSVNWHTKQIVSVYNGPDKTGTET